MVKQYIGFNNGPIYKYWLVNDIELKCEIGYELDFQYFLFEHTSDMDKWYLEIQKVESESKQESQKFNWKIHVDLEWNSSKDFIKTLKDNGIRFRYNGETFPYSRVGDYTLYDVSEAKIIDINHILLTEYKYYIRSCEKIKDKKEKDEFGNYRVND